jgi:hypothetical protein
VAKKACKYTVKFAENGTDSISLRKKRAAETNVIGTMEAHIHRILWCFLLKEQHETTQPDKTESQATTPTLQSKEPHLLSIYHQ